MATSKKETTDVVVVGSCVIDLISYAQRLPSPGETLLGSKFSIGFGGKGANQCVAAARLGAKTAMVARVGDDTFGQDYLENFKKVGVNSDFVKTTTGVATGAASICVEEGTGQNFIIIVPGANMVMSTEDIESAQEMIGSAKVVVCQLETHVLTTLNALQVAKKHGVTTILNAAPGIHNLPNEIFLNADIFCVNESEAELISGVAVTTTADAHKAARVLIGRGCSTVIITLGKDGSYFVCDSTPEGCHVVARKVVPVDSTGAGDSFVGALAYYLSNHPTLSLRESVRRSCEVATTSVLAQGTQSSYPYRKDLPEELFQDL